MSAATDNPRAIEVPLFMLGLWLIPSTIGYVLVGLLLVVDVFRWTSIYLEYREDRRRNRLSARQHGAVGTCKGGRST